MQQQLFPLHNAAPSSECHQTKGTILVEELLSCGLSAVPFVVANCESNRSLLELHLVLLAIRVVLKHPIPCEAQLHLGNGSFLELVATSLSLVR